MHTPPPHAPPEVLHRPLANAPRRAFAAAIKGDDLERAHLIGLQLRRLAAEILPVGDARHRHALREMERILLERHQARWLVGLPTGPRWSWSRGFVEGVDLDATAFVDEGPEIVARVPLLHARLRGVRGALDRLLGSAWMGQLRSLDLRNEGLTDADVEALARSPAVRNLAWMDLSANQIGQAGLEALARSSALPGLQWLGFAWNAAPDPTPTLHEDHGVVTHVEHKPEAARLMDRFGPRPWLQAPRRLTSPMPPTWVYPYEDKLDPAQEGP